MTPLADIRTIRETLAAATQGPWAPGVCRNDDEDAARDVYISMFDEGNRDHFFNVYPVPQDDRRLAIAITGNGPTSEANAILIAIAPTWLAELCDEVDALRGELARRNGMPESGRKA